MNYTVNITAAAEHDMANAADYIEFALKNPSAADHLLDEADAKLSALSSFPKQFPLVDDILLNSWGIQENHTVTIVRFLYEKSNWKSILKHGFSLI